MKSIKYFSFLLILILTALSCSEKSVNPTENQRPTGYQEDIPWPSLADSPWPMNHHDPQNTGRSDFMGPSSGVIDWLLDANYIQSGISIGLNKAIYLDKDNKLTSVNYSGLINWQYSLNGFILSTALIDKDNRIYFCAANMLYSLIDDSLNWSYEAAGNTENMMTIGIDGIIYILDRTSKLYAINSSGKLLWDYSDQDFNISMGGMAFSPDGKTLYITGKTSDIMAFDVVNKTITWSFGNGVQYNSPLVDYQGNVYYLKSESDTNPGNGILNCINKSGSFKWKYEFKFPPNTGLFYSNTPTIDKNGNIYFAYDTLYSVDYSGILRWKKSINGYSDCPLVCDGNSDIYVGTMNVDNSDTKIALSKFSSSGQKDWELKLEQSQVGGSPALSENGILIFPSWRSTKIYAIK